MARFEIHKPGKPDPIRRESKFVWIYHRLPLQEVSRVEMGAKVIEFLEEKRDTEGLELVMGTPDMPQWLFKWVR